MSLHLYEGGKDRGEWVEFRGEMIRKTGVFENRSTDGPCDACDVMAGMKQQMGFDPTDFPVDLKGRRLW